MASDKYDGVIEAVRYSPDGQIATVRVYERRGPIFSDRLLLTRQTLVERLKSGKTFVVGRRKVQLAGSFDVLARVHLVQADGRELVVGGDAPGDSDLLQGAPLF